MDPDAAVDIGDLPSEAGDIPRDLPLSEARCHRDRRELVERFAHQDATRAGAVAEIASLL
ncbi:hypothetical protein MAUB1S_05190 [Mycolicibacterium aubagnense]